MNSIAVQDYLKAIYKLSNASKPATTTELANALNVRAASVTSMLQKLSQVDPALVNYQKHQGATLTAAGQKEALRVIRQHRIVETFLCEKLNYSWDEVHEEAERLEHALSPKLVDRMAESLGFPDRDPHGQQIPNKALEVMPSTAVPLSQLQVGETAVVLRVRDDDPDLLRYVDELCLRPNAVITITEVKPIDELHHIQIQSKSTPVIVGKRITDNIFVSK